MPAVKINHFNGGQNMIAGHGSVGDDLASILRAGVDDMSAMHAAITGITAQLDADVGVTDTDFAANHDPAALTVTKA